MKQIKLFSSEELHVNKDKQYKWLESEVNDFISNLDASCTVIDIRFQNFAISNSRLSNISAMVIYEKEN